MKTRRRNVRTLKDVEKDNILGYNERTCRRIKALFRVLRSIPQRDYDNLSSHKDQILFFLPDKGVVAGLFCGRDSTVFLDKKLEGYSVSAISFFVAHLIAEILLDYLPTPEVTRGIKKEATQMVCQWGFQREMKSFQLSKLIYE